MQIVITEVGFEVLTVVSTKTAVFWVVAPCSLVEVYRRFRGPCCLHNQVFWVVAPCSLLEVYRRYRGPCCLHHQLMMEATRISETLVNFYQKIEDSNLITEVNHTYRICHLESFGPGSLETEFCIWTSVRFEQNWRISEFSCK
jgi:hypothetical protein